MTRARGRGAPVAALVIGAIAAVAAPARAQDSPIEFQAAALLSSVVEIEVSGDKAFCALRSGATVFEISDRFRLDDRSTVLSPDSVVIDMTVSDTTAYLVMGAGGVAVVEVNSRDSLSVRSVIPSRSSPVSGAAGRGPIVYAMESGALVTWVLPPSGAPRFRSQITSLFDEGRLFLAGERLFVYGDRGLAEVLLDAERVPSAFRSVISTEVFIEAVGDSSTIYAASPQGRLHTFTAIGAAPFAERERYTIALTATDLAFNDKFVVVTSDFGPRLFSVVGPGMVEPLFDRFDRRPVATAAFNGDDLLLGFDSAIESYTILPPGRTTIVAADSVPARAVDIALAGGYLYVAADPAGVYRYRADPGPGLGDREYMIGLTDVTAIAARDTVVVVGSATRGAWFYSGPPGGRLPLRSVVSYPGTSFDMATRDSVLVVAAGASGFRIITYPRIATPSLVTTFDPVPFFGSFAVRLVEDRVLYSVNRTVPTLYIYDIGFLAFPVEVGRLPLREDPHFAVDADTERMVVLHGPAGARDVVLFDISSVEAPVPLDTLRVAGAGSRIELRGEEVVVANVAPGYERLTVEDGERLIREGTVVTPGAVEAFAIGDLATYLAEGAFGLEGIAFSTEGELATIADFAFPGSITAMASSGALVVAGDDQGVVTSMRISFDGRMTILDRIAFGDRIRTISFLSDEAYVAAVTSDTLRVIRLSPAGGLSLAAPPARLTGGGVNAAVPYGDYLYVNSRANVNVFDMNNPAAPVLLNSFGGLGNANTSGAGTIRDLVINNDRLFIVFRGVQNAENPDLNRQPLITSWNLEASVRDPRYMGQYIGGDDLLYSGAAARDLFLYLAEGDGGMSVVNIADPSNMVVADPDASDEPVHQLLVVGGFLIAANGEQGLSAMDLASSASSPPVAAAVETPGFASFLATSPGHILVSDTYALLTYDSNIVVADTTGPTFSIGLLPNPFLTAYADLYVIADEPLSGPPTVRFQIEDIDTGLPVTLIDAAASVYQSNLILDRVGTGLLTVAGTDLFTNPGAASKEVVFEMLRGAEGGTITSNDSTFAVTLAPGAVSRDARVVVTQSGERDLKAGRALPALPGGAGEAGYHVGLLGGQDAPLTVAFASDVSIPASAAGRQVYVARDGGWVALPTRFESGWFRAESPGQGIFWLAQGEAGGSLLPREAALYPNAPNPFNPSTRIAYDVPLPGARVSLAVYSVEGRAVRTLVEEFRAAGRHEIARYGLHDRGVATASGIYVLRFDTGAKALTRKMALVR